jgi:hypothetical protein
MAVHGEDAQGKTADSKVKALDGNLWVQLPPITPKTFLKSFQKGIDKSQGLWYNKDSQGAVAQESRRVHTSVSRGSKPLIPQ